MADSTDWTLEFVDHNSNTIVLIPTVAGDEMSDNYYFHLVDGTFDISAPKAKRMWAGSGNVDKMGESLVSQTYENRKMTMTVEIVSSSKNYIIDGFQQLHRFANECGVYAMYPSWHRGYWYVKKQWEGTESTLYSYILILAADISPLPNLYGEAGVQWHDGSQYRVPVDIELTTEPAWRGGTGVTGPFSTGVALVSGHEVYLDSDSGDNYVPVTGSNILGDLPPLLRIKLYLADSGESCGSDTYHIAARSRDDLSSMESLWTEAEDAYELGVQTTSTSDSSASGGYRVTIQETVAGDSDWRLSLRYTYARYLTGTFRIRARCKVPSAAYAPNIGIWAESLYRYTTTFGWNYWKPVGDGQPKYLEANTYWQFIDLGKISLTYPRRLYPTAYVFFRIWSEHATTADILYIDYVELVPVDDGSGWVTTSQGLMDYVDNRQLIIDQRQPGEQNLIYSYGNAYTNEFVDYDLSHITLYPGKDSRLYFNTADLSDKDYIFSVDVNAIFRYLTVA